MNIVLIILSSLLLLGLLLFIISLIVLGKLLKATEAFYNEIEDSNQ